MRVPGVTVHDVRFDIRPGPGNGATHRAEDGSQIVGGGHATWFGKAAHVQPPVVDVLVTEAPHVDVHQARQLTAEKLDVYARTAVDVRRIFVREQQCSHPATVAIARCKRRMPSRMRSGAALEKLKRRPLKPPSPLG